METKNGDTQFNKKFLNRDSLLSANARLIDQIEKRVSGKRFRPGEGDSLKLGFYRVLIQALQLQNIILKDTELEELNARITALEAKELGNVSDASYKEVEPCED